MKSWLLALMALLSIQSASAQVFGSSEVREVSLRHKTGWYSTGNTLVHHFSDPTYVERMLISAEGYRNFAKAYVYADGDMVSLLGVPGRDPDYPVVIRKTVSSIVIKFEGDVRILDFRIYVGGSSQEGFTSINPHQLDTPAELGRAVIQVVANLQATVSPANFNQFLLPLRKSALVLAAKGRARPLLSDNTQRQARVMIAQIEAAESFLLNTLGPSSYYSEQIQTLLFVKEKLQSLYEIY